VPRGSKEWRNVAHFYSRPSMKYWRRSQGDHNPRHDTQENGYLQVGKHVVAWRSV